MFPAFSIALSALSADSTAIDVVGNNLANLNTTGYKDDQRRFSRFDVTEPRGGPECIAGRYGHRPGGNRQQLHPRDASTTNGPTDAAIQGNGFFVVQNAANQTLYTRDGSFQVNAAGNIVTATGENVQGWSAVNGTVNPNGPVGNLAIPLGSAVPAIATTTMSLKVNLNSQVATTDPGASFSAPIQVIDSQGASHTLTLNFTKTAANTWSYKRGDSRRGPGGRRHNHPRRPGP